MHIAVELVTLVLAVLVVTAASERLGLPAPVVLVAVGAVAAYVPLVPEVRLNEEIVLVGLLPPLLYNAALRTSLVDFKANRRVILLLSIGLVIFTTIGIGVVVRLVLPEVPWWAAFAIGAVVAPPDAVAATAVARRIGIPRRLVTVLEGESLVNDATALVSLRTALSAAVSVSVLGVGLDFVWTTLGGVLVGVAVYGVVARVRRHLTDPVLDVSVSIIIPFIAYVGAEVINASGVLAVVLAGLLLGHNSPVLQTASSRISESVNWQTVSFLLENAVFLLIGLQARWIFAEVMDSSVPGPQILGACLAVLAAVVALRFVWVFSVRSLLLFRNLDRRHRPPLSYSVVVAWAGMRGVVTLAAAFAIPEDTPLREVLLLIAFAVTAGTLALQGLSLPWVVRRLGVPGPDPRADALARAELLQQATQAGLTRLAELEQAQPDDPVHDLLRSRLEQLDFAAWERLGAGPGGTAVDGAAGAAVLETPSERYSRIRLDMLAAERGRVLELREYGRTPHEVVEDVLTMLDVEESIIGRRVERRRELSDALGGTKEGGRAVDACSHLTESKRSLYKDAPPASGPDGSTPACEDCLVEGTTWVHLRTCLTCGHTGCCDSSPRRHASAHFSSTTHPVVRSAETGEDWRWCFVDEIVG